MSFIFAPLFVEVSSALEYSASITRLGAEALLTQASELEKKEELFQGKKQKGSSEACKRQ